MYVIRERRGKPMNVYIKNTEGQQTVRYLPIHKALWLRILVFARYCKEDRPIVRFVIWKEIEAWLTSVSMLKTKGISRCPKAISLAHGLPKIICPWSWLAVVVVWPWPPRAHGLMTTDIPIARIARTLARTNAAGAPIVYSIHSI